LQDKICELEVNQEEVEMITARLHEKDGEIDNLRAEHATATVELNKRIEGLTEALDLSSQKHTAAIKHADAQFRTEREKMANAHSCAFQTAIEDVDMLQNTILREKMPTSQRSVKRTPD
jgi:peptidoglycan hydrolase CwlO-like protein